MSFQADFSSDDLQENKDKRHLQFRQFVSPRESQHWKHLFANSLAKVKQSVSDNNWADGRAKQNNFYEMLKLQNFIFRLATNSEAACTVRSSRGSSNRRRMAELRQSMH